MMYHVFETDLCGVKSTQGHHGKTVADEDDVCLIGNEGAWKVGGCHQRDRLVPPVHCT